MTVPTVLHLTYGLDFGGVEMQMRLIAENQARYRHKFCAINGGGAAQASILETGASAEALGIDCWRRPLRTIIALSRFIRGTRPDVVHTHGSEPNLFGLLAAWIAGVPIRIAEEIGMPKHSRRGQIGYSIAYRLADRVVGVSDAVRNFLVSSGEVPARKAIRIYNPARFPTVRAQARERGERLRIGYLGRLSPEKNPTGLVRAVLRLIEQGLDVGLVVIGDGPQGEQIQSLASAAPDRINLTGYLNQPFELLATCHALVQPSLSEGFGLAVVEGMAMGLPVISTPVGGAREIIEHGTTGWILEDLSDEAIASAIQRAVQLEPNLLHDMGTRAARSVKGRFSATKYVAKIEQLYDEVRAEKYSGTRRAMGYAKVRAEN